MHLSRETVLPLAVPLPWEAADKTGMQGPRCSLPGRSSEEAGGLTNRLILTQGRVGCFSL